MTYLIAFPLTRVLPSLETIGYGVISANKINSQYFISIDSGRKASQIPIKFQPHGILLTKPDQLIVIGKRPSDLLAVVDLKNKRVSKTIHLPYGRHFWGHAVIDTDSQSLYATEYDFENETSIISEWSLNDLKQKSFFQSHGISGHDLIISENTLICANGGFLTSPEFGRMILSEEVTSSLSVIDKGNYNLIASVKPPENHMSFRHLCQTKDTVFVGLQNKTKQYYKNETTIAALDKSSMKLTSVVTQNDGNKGYITSITNFKDQFIVATSHVNNSIYFIDAKTNSVLKVVNEQSPQGIQVVKDKMYITVENGILEIDDELNYQAKSLPHIGFWQNHCLT